MKRSLKTLLKPVSDGFTITEVVTAIVFAGIVSIMTVPLVIQSVSSQESCAKTKQMALELQAALQRFDSDTPPGAPAAIALQTKFTATENDDTAILMSSYRGTNVSCSPQCFRYADHGILIPATTLSSSGTRADFLYDPDGTGNAQPVILTLDLLNTRVTTGDAASIISTWDTTGNAVDPTYVQKWTKQP